MSSEGCTELKPGEYLPKLQFSRIWDSFISQSQPNYFYLCSFICVKLNTNEIFSLQIPTGFFLCDHVCPETHTNFLDIS